MRSEQDAPEESPLRSKPRRLFIAGGLDGASQATEPSRPVLSVWPILFEFLRSLKLRASQDLLLLFISAALLPALLIIPLAHIRIPLGLVLVLFAPGYALVAALFPRRYDANGVTRVGLSFGLSIALMPSIVLVLELMSISLKPVPMVVSLSIWVAFWTTLALLRRQALAVGDVVSFPSLDLSASHGISLLRSLPPRIMVLGASILIIILSMILLLSTDSQQASTEFYILGAEGEARDYPREAEVGATLSATLGILNRETSAHEYRVHVWASDLAAPKERALVSISQPIVVQPHQPFQETITWRMPVAGEDKTVQFLLYRDGDADADPHRELQLSLNVEESKAATP